MRSSTSWIDLLRPNLVIALGVLSCAAVSAQAQNLQEVTVKAPNVKTIGRDDKGTAIRQLSASATVQYNPIMLTTSSGRALLNDKIAQVARNLCSGGGQFNNTDDDLNCVRKAIEDAKSQLDAESERIKVSSR